MIVKANAIQSLRPNSKWQVIDNDTIVWLDTEQTQPTDAEIAAEITRLEADYAAKQYQRSRAAKYPAIGDQLDALWKGGAAAEEMLAAVMAVKSKYPKPE
jgi:uncharacterized small protein (DUF1192 family)